MPPGNHTNNRFRESVGFSVVELLITIGIISILMAIGLTQFASFVPNMQLRAAVRDLYSNMQNARLNAVKTNTTWAIVFVPSTNKYLLCSDDGPDGTWSTTADNTCPNTFDLTTSYKNGVQFGHGNITGNNSVTGDPFPVDNVSYASEVLSFSPQGTSNAGYVYLENENKDSIYAIGSLSSGAINIFKWSGTAWEK